MTDGPTVVIEGRDYTIVARLGRNRDGEAIATARDEDGQAVTLVRGRHNGRWRLWTATVHEAAPGKGGE